MNIIRYSSHSFLCFSAGYSSISISFHQFLAVLLHQLCPPFQATDRIYLAVKLEVLFIWYVIEVDKKIVQLWIGLSASAFVVYLCTQVLEQLCESTVIEDSDGAILEIKVMQFPFLEPRQKCKNILLRVILSKADEQFLRY